MKEYPTFFIVLAVLIQFNVWGIPGTVGEEAAMVPGSIAVAKTSTGGLYGGMISYDDVALIVNDNSIISLEIGNYFAGKRGIPPERIINVTVPNQETINPSQFDDLANQVKDALRIRGLTETINYMVTTTGVPLRVSGNNWRMASVDEELMLLDGPYEDAIHGNYWIDCPYYDSWKPFSKAQYGIRLVTRLTGYTVEEAKGLVDLSDASFGVTGRALLDMDPGKGYQPSGYGYGNYWMIGAHDWLTDNGHESLLDDNNTFRTGWTNTSAYYSWGSNDGDWGRWLLSNSDFERGTGTVPAAWNIIQNSGSAQRSQESVDGGSYSLKMTRPTTGNTLLADQSYTLEYPDHRYIFEGRANLASVASGSARAFAEGFDSGGTRVYYKEFYNRTGTRAWESFQGVIENRTDVVRIRVAVTLDGTGTVYWDNVVLRVIRPHNQWVPGAIAETCVSTGGRSMTYGTWYGQSLVVDLVRDGVTGVKGYVYEPFLSAMSHADIMIPAYYSGYSLAEAFWMGSELNSWMGTVIGDPKCTPYVGKRADMGFGPVPLSTGVDEKGEPYLVLSLYNKGGSLASNGLVEFYMDDVLLDSRQVPLPAGAFLNITYAYDDLDRDIQGLHEFKAVLNSDRTIWEFDSSNDLLVEKLTVDTMPRISIEVQESLAIVRTHRGLFNITISDIDMDMPEIGPSVEIEDPVNVRFAPVLLGSEQGVGEMTYRYAVDFPHDSVLGFYDISTTYIDPAGSPANAQIKSAIKLINAKPTMEGSLSSQYAGRGTEVLLNLSWHDEDTPDGDLAVTTSVSGLPGVRLSAGDPNMTSNESCTYRIAIPSEHASQTYTVSVRISDRDDETISWTDEFRTSNAGPSVSVLGGVPGEYTRLEVVPLSFLYTDPESLKPDSFNVQVIEKVTSGIGTVVYEQTVEPEPGVPFSLGIVCKYLPLGSLDLRLSCVDDEEADFVLLVPDAITILNVRANVSFHSLQFKSVKGDPGGPLIRGDTLGVSVNAKDPDESGAGVTVRGRVMRGDEEVYSMDLEWKGGELYTGRVLTTKDWPEGPYWINVTTVDDAGEETYLIIDPAFEVTTKPPSVDSGSLKVDAWGWMNVSVALIPGPGQCFPVKILLTIRGGMGETDRLNLTPSSSGIQWTYSGKAPFSPTGAQLQVTDDSGRVALFNDSLTISVSPPLKEPIGETPGTDDTLLVAMIGLLAIVVLLVIVIFIVIVLRPKGTNMQPAPMMQVPGMAPSPLRSALDPPIAGALPGPAPPQLPPSSELFDGTHYHPPSLKVSQPPATPRPKTAELIRESPMPPVPAPPEPPAMSEPGEGLKSEEMIEPPAHHVPNTDDPDIPRDTG